MSTIEGSRCCSQLWCAQLHETRRRLEPLLKVLLHEIRACSSHVMLRSSELLPVPRTHGLGVMMGLEVADGTTQFQPGVQARGDTVGAGAWGFGGAGGA